MKPLNFTDPQGRTLTVNSPDNSIPTEAELDRMFSIKYGQPSVSSQGLSYVKEHPFKTALQPLAQTLTGKSFQERALEATAPKEIPVRQIGRTAIGPTEKDFTGQFLKQALAGMAGSVADIATTPASYVPIPGAQLAGKIPVGSTTVGRIAQNVAVRPGFVKGVGELQRLESALQQSGKLSSRGIYQQEYKPGIENPVFRAFVAAVQPNLRKFKSGKDLQNYKKDVVTAIQTINDYAPALQLKNPETEQITNLPTQSRNIVDFLLNKNAPNNKALLVDALEQTKRKLWQSTSGMSREASSQGVKIDMGKEVTHLLDETIKSPQMNTYRSDLVEEAIRLKKKYALRGEVSPIEVEDDLKYLNQEIGKVWNSKDKNAVDFYLRISQSLRKKMDDSIEEFLGKSGWQDGRNKYRALKNIESDVLRSAAKTALKGDSTLGDKLLDTFAGEELVRSILTLNPKILANAASIESFRVLRGHFFNPDVRIKDLFKMVGKSAIGPTTKTRPLNPNQPSRGFPFPEGPASIRQPVQGPPRLPYTPQAQMPPRQSPQGKPGIVEGKPKDVKEIMKSWDTKGIENWISEKGDTITLSKIIVPKNSRSEGVGTKAMQELIDYADINGKKIYLTPTKDFGGSVERLNNFYKDLGFVKNKSYSHQETLVRHPVTQGQKSPLTAAEAVKGGMGAEEWVASKQPKKVTFVSATKKADYMGGHEAPMAEDINNPVWDLTGKFTGNKLYPEDVYGSDATRLYSSGFDYDNQAMSILHSVKNRPNARITIYRAVPKDTKGEITPGDWVAITRDYAKDHGESNLGSNFKIIKKNVFARDIFTDANSIQEFGYDPQPRLEPKDTPYELLSKAYKEGKTDLHSQYQSQLLSEYEAAKGARGSQNPLRNKSGQAFIGGGQENTPQFKNWFGTSKVVDDSGKPLVVYSGHGNSAMYGSKYSPKKGTAGGFYATEDPKVASNYALGKFGNMEMNEGGKEYAFRDANGNYTKKLSGITLTDEQLSKLEKFKKLSNEYGDNEPISEMDRWIEQSKRYDKQALKMSYTGGSRNLQNIHDFYENQGYTIRNWAEDRSKPEIERFRNSSFDDLLDYVGFDWTSHWQPRPGVMPVYLNIKNPLDASKPFPKDLLQTLKNVAAREQTKEYQKSAHWTKEYSMKEWVKSIEEGSEYWSTQIPEKAIPIMKRFGYDGVKELGMKGNNLTREQRQINWIAFDPGQIKSSIGNKGTFDPKNKNITMGILGPTMATGIGLAAALKATAARGETGESLDPKYKQQIANAENYGKTEGDWAQIEDIVIRDLKRIGKLKQNITLEQVKADPQLYDKVAKLYWDRLDAFGIPEKDKALWWLMPGRYRQTGGDISRLKNPEHRNIMQNRVKNIGGK